jgi:hypothetical protein
MTTSDIIAIANIVATVLAVLGAPIIALWIGGILQTRTERRREKLRVLSQLLALRHEPSSLEGFRTLNMIDAVFADDLRVREAWSRYYAALNDPNLQNPPGYSARDEKRRELLIEIVRSLGLENTISTSDLLRAYMPNLAVEIDYLAAWERIKRREDLKAEFLQRDIGFPDFTPTFFPPPSTLNQGRAAPTPAMPQQSAPDSMNGQTQPAARPNSGR